jgi:hypothetical protein
LKELATIVAKITITLLKITPRPPRRRPTRFATPYRFVIPEEAIQADEVSAVSALERD